MVVGKCVLYSAIRARSWVLPFVTCSFSCSPGHTPGRQRKGTQPLPLCCVPSPLPQLHSYPCCFLICEGSLGGQINALEKLQKSYKCISGIFSCLAANARQAGQEGARKACLRFASSPSLVWGRYWISTGQPSCRNSSPGKRRGTLQHPQACTSLKGEGAKNRARQEAVAVWQFDMFFGCMFPHS